MTWAKDQFPYSINFFLFFIFTKKQKQTKKTNYGVTSLGKPVLNILSDANFNKIPVLDTGTNGFLIYSWVVFASESILHILF